MRLFNLATHLGFALLLALLSAAVVRAKFATW
jgi:hypothetical protein